MSYCTRRTATEIQADIDRYEAMLTAAEESYLAILNTANRVNRFDDSEGAQSTTKRDLADQQSAIDFLKNKLKKLRAELCRGTNRIVHINRRNISGGGY